MPGSQPIRSAAVARKIEILLLHLEGELASESFYLAQENGAAMLEILPRQAEVIEAIERLVRSAELDEPTRLAITKRLDKIAASRRLSLGRVGELIAARKAEVARLSQAAARLRLLRRTAASTEEQVPAPLRGWA